MADNVDINIYCPACGKEMVKIFLPEQGINLDVCLNGCGGIYFDNREFLKVDEPHEDITPLVEVLEGKTFKSVDESQVRICPVCGSNMVKNFASAKHEVQVDECYSCGGKFLDYGELDKIRAQYSTEKQRAADVIKELYYTAGTELKTFNSEYESLECNPQSILYRELKIKTDKEKYIEKYKYYYIRRCSFLGGFIGFILGIILPFIINFIGIFDVKNNIAAFSIAVALLTVLGNIIGCYYGILTANKAVAPKPLG